MIYYNGDDGSLGKDGDSMTVLTYNLLAPHLSPDLCWDERKAKLLEELKHYNADVICLQEIVDIDVRDFFGPKLEEHGYNFVLNTQENEVHYGGIAEPFEMGCAIFYKESSFRIKKEYKFNFCQAANQFLKEHNLETHPQAHRLQKNKAGIACVLEFLPKKKKLMVCVVAVHLTSVGHLLDVKTLQTYLLLRELAKIQATKMPIILAGDFNIGPTSEAYMMITRKQMPTKVRANVADAIDIRPLLDSLTEAPLGSAYSTVVKPGSRQGLKECRRMNQETMEPKFTYISRKSKYKYTADYIFYTGEDFTVEGILELIDDVEKLPNEVWPSDHIALMAYMQLNQNRKVNYKLDTIEKPPWSIPEQVNASTSEADCKEEEISINKEAEQKESEVADHQEIEGTISKEADRGESETTISKEADCRESEIVISKDAGYGASEAIITKEDGCGESERIITEESDCRESETSNIKRTDHQEIETGISKETGNRESETFTINEADGPESFAER